MHSNTATKTAAVLLLATLAQAKLNCDVGNCINCIANINYTRKCGLCRYERTTKDGDCSGNIPIDKCESYTDSDGLCKICKEDYYLNSDSKGCTKIGIDRCRWAQLAVFNSTTNASRVNCQACDRRYPASDLQSCTDEEVRDTCKYGGFAVNSTPIVSPQDNSTTGTKYCWACKKGFSRSANTTYCVEACSHGCYYCDLDFKCTTCDKYNGYYEVWRSRDYGYPKCDYFGWVLRAGSAAILAGVLALN